MQVAGAMGSQAGGECIESISFGRDFVMAFGKMFGGTMGIGCAIIVLLAAIPIGCTMLVGGCLVATAPAVKSAQEAARAAEERAKREDKSGPVVAAAAKAKAESTAVGDDRAELEGAFRSVPDAVLSGVIDDTKEAEAAKAKASEPNHEHAEAKRQAALDEARWHTWTSGTHSTEAKYVKTSAGMAYLEKKDGTTITISMDKLSDEDQKWIRTQGWKRAASQ
jgi:hypothetical protein